MDPAPPPHDESHWRNQVLNFLNGPLNRNVLDHQPSLFGVGLFKLSSPNVVNALVSHGHFPVQNSFVRFVKADDAEQNHRASQGFRKGWLMMLGIHPDYRNDLDIANAVSTFGKFHSWNRDDPIKERVLVFASFSSPTLVPRDVVFGKFATVRGVKESWTAHVFIPSADFADVLPADEDPMPPDGNPHPLPGNLQPDLNLFVNPQYLEIGWDAGPEQHFDAPADGNNNENQMEEVLEEVQESMVMNLSENSFSLVNMQNQEIPQVQVPGAQHMDIIQVGRVTTVFGPSLPPDMLWDKIFQFMIPDLYAKTIPLSLQMSPFAFLKRNWATAFEFKFKGFPKAAVEDVNEMEEHDVVLLKERPVARALVFDRPDEESTTTIFSASPVSARKKRGRKMKMPIVQPEEHRFTRSCLKKDGCRPASILSVQPRPKKKARAMFLLVLQQDEGAADSTSTDGAAHEEYINILATHIAVMQKVGLELGIAPEKLTKEQLEADPASSSSTDTNDDA
ncbi:hypothetical protein ACQ4PT_050826 [Festuca glaucescens]